MEIQGHPNYLIYPDGRVYSKKRWRSKECWMKACKDIDGYKYVVLTTDGKQYNMKIHRLIAIHYIPNPDNKPTVDHINRIRDDNRIDNLRWATIKEQNENRVVSIPSLIKKGHDNSLRKYKNKFNHRGITKNKYGYYYTKTIKKKKFVSYFNKSLTMCLVVKFITLLKLKRL